MKTVHELIKENKHLAGQISIRYAKEIDTVSVDATKDGLLFLAKLFEAQANNLGNMAVAPVRCTSIVTKSEGIFADDSVKQLQIHNMRHG